MIKENENFNFMILMKDLGRVESYIGVYCGYLGRIWGDCDEV